MGEMDPYERTRETTVVTSSHPYEGYWQGYAGTCSNPQYAPQNQYYPYTGSFDNTIYKIMFDVVTPRFKEFMSKGMIVNSPMNKTTVTKIYGLAAHAYDSRYTVDSCSPPKQLYRGGKAAGTACSTSWIDTRFNNGGFAPTPDIDEERLINLAVTKCWANADQSEAAALATLGEAKETVTSMYQILGRVISIVRAAKRLEFKKLAKELSPRELENRYMEFRYALRPLYYDCKQMLDAVVEHSKKKDFGRYTFRSKVLDSQEINRDETGLFNFGDPIGSKYTYTLSATTKREFRVRCGLLCDVAPASWLNTWGFDGVAETCWELIPFSFIVDWFFNIGDLIASWTPEAGLAMLASWYVVEDTTYQYTKITGSSFVPAAGQNYVNPTYTMSNCWKSVTTVNKYRVPEPQRSALPRFNLNLDTLKLADLLIIGKKIFLNGRLK